MALLSVQVWADLVVGGIEPGERPKSAPVITEVVKGPDWYSTALTGISQPYPNSLRFLEDQGNWHTPFSRPGMVGKYDIRRWHESAASENGVSGSKKQ